VNEVQLHAMGCKSFMYVFWQWQWCPI